MSDNTKVNDITKAPVVIVQGVKGANSGSAKQIAQNLTTMGVYLSSKCITKEAADEFIDSAKEQTESEHGTLPASIQNVVATLKSTVEAAVNSNDGDKIPDNFFTASFQALIYQSMSNISKSSIDIANDFAQYMVSAALKYGGLTKDGDKLTIDRDSNGNPTGGLLGQQVQLGVQSAQDAESAAEHDAIGMFISAGVSGAALATSGVVAFVKRNGPLEDQQQVYTRFSSNLNGNAKSDPVLAANMEQEKVALQQQKQDLTVELGGQAPGSDEAMRTQGKINDVDQQMTNKQAQIDEQNAIEKKIAEISTDRQATDQFIQEDKAGQNKEFNDKVLAQLRGSGNEANLKAVRENSQALSNSIQSQMDANNNSYNNWIKNLDIGQNMGSQAGQGAEKIESAKLTQKSQEEKAYEDAVKSLNQTWQGYITNAQDNAKTSRTNAYQIAEQYAQIKI